MPFRRTLLGVVLGPALLAASASSAGCSGNSGDEGAAEGAHTAGEIEWAQASAPMWADFDRSLFDSRYPDKTAAGHAVEQRVDAWVKHLDDLARDIVRASTTRESLAPKPYARLIVDKSPRVTGHRVLACIAGAPPQTISDGGTDAAPPAADAGAPTGDAGALDTLAVMVGERTVFSTNTPGASCLAPPGWTAHDGLAWFNGLGGHHVAERGAYAVVERQGSEPVAAKRVAIESAAPAIDVSTSMVSGLSETGMVVALARELARFHRAHETTGVHERFGFVYEHQDTPGVGAPQPAADQDAYRAAIEKVHLPRFLIGGQKFHPRVMPTLLRWMTKLDWDAGHPCFEAKRFLLNDTKTAKDELTLDWRTTETAPEALSSTARRAVLQWEPKAVKCMDALALTTGAGPSTFPHGKLIATDTKLPRAWFLDNIDAPLEESAGQAAADLTVPSLRALVTRLEEVAKGVDAQASELEKKLRENRVAIATEVQEADAVALELAMRSGISPRRVFDGFFELMALDEANDPTAFAAANANVSVEECKAWFDAGFREVAADGTAVELYVPGALSPEKPSWCVRVHDLMREARRHPLPPQPMTGPFDPASWDSLQAQAEVLTASAPTSVPPPPTPTLEQPDAGPQPTPRPAVTGEEVWQDEGWTPPHRAGTTSNSQPTRRFAGPTRSGGCSVGAERARSGEPLPWLMAIGALGWARSSVRARRRPVR